MIIIFAFACGCGKNNNTLISNPDEQDTFSDSGTEEVFTENEDIDANFADCEEDSEVQTENTESVSGTENNSSGGTQSSKVSSNDNTEVVNTNNRNVTVRDTVNISAKYGYYEMIADIDMLVNKYPNLLVKRTLGYSEFGRPIPMIIFGNSNCKNKVLIVASSHAREYGNTAIIMKTIEYYCQNVNNIIFGNKTIQTLISSTAVYFVPMHNPDGVEIAINGISSVPDVYKETVRALYNKSAKKGIISSYSKWKANGLGVDLNRDYGLGLKTSTQVSEPLSENYGGNFSSKEGQAIANLIKKENFASVTSFHSCGEEVYWGSFASGNFKQEYYKMAQDIQNCNGYRLIDDSSKTEKDYPYYGLKDWFMKDYQKPGFTIETGTSTPLSLSAINTAYNKNIKITAIMLDYAYTESAAEITATPTVTPDITPNITPTVLPETTATSNITATPTPELFDVLPAPTGYEATASPDGKQ